MSFLETVSGPNGPPWSEICRQTRFVLSVKSDTHASADITHARTHSACTPPSARQRLSVNSPYQILLKKFTWKWLRNLPLISEVLFFYILTVKKRLTLRIRKGRVTFQFILACVLAGVNAASAKPLTVRANRALQGWLRLPIANFENNLPIFTLALAWWLCSCCLWNHQRWFTSHKGKSYCDRDKQFKPIFTLLNQCSDNSVS